MPLVELTQEEALFVQKCMAEALGAGRDRPDLVQRREAIEHKLFHLRYLVAVNSQHPTQPNKGIVDSKKFSALREAMEWIAQRMTTENVVVLSELTLDGTSEWRCTFSEVDGIELPLND